MFKNLVSMIFPSRAVIYAFIVVAGLLSTFWWYVGNLRVHSAKTHVVAELTKELRKQRSENKELTKRLRILEQREAEKLEASEQSIHRHFEHNDNPVIPESTLCLLDDTCEVQ